MTVNYSIKQQIIEGGLGLKYSLTTPIFMQVSSGPTADRPTGLTTADTGKYGYFDTTTKDFVVWTGTTWSDLDEP